MTDRLHVCMIGSGGIAAHHCQGYREIGGEYPTVLSFCDVDLLRAEAMRREFDGTAVYGSIEAACAAEDVDVH